VLRVAGTQYDTYTNFNKNNEYGKGRKDGNVARIK